MAANPGPFSVGFITGTQANVLNQMFVAMQAQLRNTSNNALNSNLNNLQTFYPPMKFFRAKLTGYDPDTEYFDWVEQSYETSAGGEPYDKPSGLTGTFELQPAKLMPGLPVPADVSPYNPVQCVMVQKGVTTFGSIEYEIVFIVPSTTHEFVTCVSVTKEEGVVTDVVVETQEIRFFGELVGDPVCETSPEEPCCEDDITTECCPDDPTPNVLCVTYNIVGGSCGSLTNGQQFRIRYYAPGEHPFVPVGTYPNGAWFGSFLSSGTFATTQVWLYCSDVPSWGVRVITSYLDGSTNCQNYDGFCADLVIDSFACDPFTLQTETYDFASAGACVSDPACDCAFNLTITDDPTCGESPPPGDCCPVTTSGIVSVNATDDFAALNNLYSFVHDPAAIDTIFASVLNYDGRFQWIGTMVDGVNDPYVFFGCLDGAYYWGFSGNGMTHPFMDYAPCFAALTTLDDGDGHEWYSTVDVVSNTICVDGLESQVTLVGSGGMGCEGSITLFYSVAG